MASCRALVAKSLRVLKRLLVGAPGVGQDRVAAGDRVRGGEEVKFGTVGAQQPHRLSAVGTLKPPLQTIRTSNFQRELNVPFRREALATQTEKRIDLRKQGPGQYKED